MIEVYAPAVFGDKTLSDKVLAISVELKRAHCSTSATDEHNADDKQHGNG
jgi:hypothetical protein